MADSDDVALPKATIQKMVKELMPADMRVGGDAIDILCACCSEFVQLLASEANEIATKEKKSTITPEFILKAIRDLGFTDFLEEVTATMEQHKEESKGEVTAQRENFLGHDSTIHCSASSSHRKAMKKTGADREGLSEEEQIRIQQEMFAAARLRSMGSQALPPIASMNSAANLAPQAPYQHPKQVAAGLGEGDLDGDELEEME